MNQTFGEKADIEAMLRGAEVNRLLFGCKQIKKQRGQPGGVKLAGNELIARAMPTAAAAVHKEHENRRRFGDSERAVEGHACGWDLDF